MARCFVLLSVVFLLLAGCASSPTALTASTTSPAATASVMTTATAPKLPPPPPPQVGTCDLVVNSAGTGTGGVRDGGCALSGAIPGLSKDAHSLLVEIAWASLPASALALRSTLENPAACGGQLPVGTPCSELASNSSMQSPVRIMLDGEAFAKYASALTAYENIYTGAAVQQSFKLTFSVFVQDHVPGNYTALP